jgi:hypothetical protein
MISRDVLLIGDGDEKWEKRAYIIPPQDKIKTRFSTKVLICLIASFSSLANLILMFIYVVNPNTNRTMITLIQIGFMIIVILCFIVFYFTQRAGQPQRLAVG